MRQRQPHIGKLWRRLRGICAAFLVSVALVTADYFLSNLSFPLLDASESLWWFGWSAQKREDAGFSELLCVNVGLDKDLAVVRDEYGDIIGHAAITDRAKLLDFLQVAATADYKYLFLDIRFEKELETEADSALFAQMRALPRFTFSTHRSTNGYELADSTLIGQSSRADYRSNMFSGFTRYEFLQDGQESVALRMYRDLTGSTIRRCGPVYLSGGRPCYNLQFVPMPSNLLFPYGKHGEIRYPYLGSQVMGMHTDDELAGMMKDRIVIIGDFDNDLHQSYIGEVPGPLISYYAYRLLKDGGHCVNPAYVLILLLVYSLIAYSLLYFRSWTRKWMELLRCKSPLSIFLLSMLSWEAVLLLLKAVLYLIFGISFIAVIPSFVFSLFALWKSYMEIRDEAKKNNK